MRPPQPEFPAAWRSSAAFCVAVSGGIGRLARFCQHLASASQAGHPMKELFQRKEIDFAKCRERGPPAMFDGVCNETVLIVVDIALVPRSRFTRESHPAHPKPLGIGERCVSLGPVRAGAPHSKGGGKSENVLSVDENHYVSGGDDEHCMMPLHVSAPLCGCDRSGFGARGAARRCPISNARLTLPTGCH